MDGNHKSWARLLTSLLILSFLISSCGTKSDLTRGSYPVGDSINATLYEMGHAFGVDHSSNSSNLMYGSVNGTIVYPQQDDKNGVNAVYS